MALVPMRISGWATAASQISWALRCVTTTYSISYNYIQFIYTQIPCQVPNEVGSLEPLRGYQGEDIEIQLPGSLTVYDIDWLAVWCVEYRHNFGHVFIPKDLDVPPALGQTKITVSVWVNLENQLVVSISKRGQHSLHNILHLTYI